MSQRNSGYARKDADLYETPAWVTRALLPHLPRPIGGVWEPACGNGKMADVLLLEAGFCVSVSDLRTTGHDFLTFTKTPDQETGAIITNPPYEQAREFCEHALRLMEPTQGSVAMLLRTDFDHAASRAHLFRDCPAFAKKVVLTKRVAWFVEANGKPKASPSYNHAWYIWDWRHAGPPTISYGPTGSKFNLNVNLPEGHKSVIGANHADLFTHPSNAPRSAHGTGPAPCRDTGPRASKACVAAGTTGGTIFGGTAP